MSSQPGHLASINGVYWDEQLTVYKHLCGRDNKKQESEVVSLEMWALWRVGEYSQNVLSADLVWKRCLYLMNAQLSRCSIACLFSFNYITSIEILGKQ